MWKAGLVRPSDTDYSEQMSARGSARGNSPVPSMASARSVATSRLTEGRRSKLEALLSQEDNKPKKKVAPRRRRPRVSSSNDLRKAAAQRTHRNRQEADQRQQTRSTGPRLRGNEHSGGDSYERNYDDDEREGGGGGGRGRGRGGGENLNRSTSVTEETTAPSKRGVTVVLPEAVFFNGMNCIERPHWSVVDVGRAGNGEDQTMSLSMWLSPSSSLRLKKTDGQKAQAARMKSNLSKQAMRGSEDLTVQSSSGGVAGDDGGGRGDWYVVINRQKTMKVQDDPIDRMLGEWASQGDGGGTSGNGGGTNGGAPTNVSSDMVAPVTLDTLAQHQIDAAILGADFSINGLSTPQISINGANGTLCVRAQFKPTDGGSVMESTLLSNLSCPFGKWTHVVVVISGANVRLYLNGCLDSQIYLNGPVFMPQESTLYVGRNIPVGGVDEEEQAQELGFVGFLAHVIVHGRALDKIGINAMANAPRPALPREQDEWSLLSEYDAKRDREKKLEVRREKIEKQRMEREQLDAQVAYNIALKQQMKKDEKLADHRHLSKYGADSDSMKTEIEGKVRKKRELAKAQMDAQKKVEDMKNRADQERRMAEEISEVRLLQKDVKRYQTDEMRAKDKALRRAKLEAQEYRRLAIEKEIQKEAEKERALREREEAEKTARDYRAQMTARETDMRRKRREYKAALDAQVNRKRAANSSNSHLSPTERSLNRQMLASMARVDMTAAAGETGSQWNGSQYSHAYGSPGSIRGSRFGEGGGGGGGSPTSPRGVATGRINPVAPGWRGSMGSKYKNTSAVSRQEIMDLLDSDML